jgi:AcrR family transcriptional regulator
VTSTVDPRAERTRARALAAASTLLVEDGLDAVTHARVAEKAGVGRRSMYRHWPNHVALLHDTLAQIRAPTADPSQDFRNAAIAHLTALAAALHDGRLAYVVAALRERSEHAAEFDGLRAGLAHAGCGQLEKVVRAAVKTGELPIGTTTRMTCAVLEGPLFYWALVHRRRATRADIIALVDNVMAPRP